ncbi:MAG TPA: putative lipid II flippase FtsW [Elusimicrobia bacterium]|nr:putative lipid II flippase FtsW [Elusimicrobiota bacterium]HBT60837.1 putative lipid II flippase FtsW [Elusimicrobiota bacterium]
MRRKSPMDYTLLAVILALLAWGLIMVFSSSAILAERRYGGALFFFKRQLLWAALGLVAMWFFSRFNYNRLKEWVWPIFFMTGLALAAALLAPAREKVHRWLPLGPFTLQPSEFAKFTCVLFLAHYMDRKHSKAASPVWGIAVPAGMVSLLLILIALEPDLGTPILIFSVTVLILWIGGGKLSYLLGAAACSLPIVAYEISKHPYRLKRMAHYVSMLRGSSDASYQLEQAIMAVGAGGWLGKGIGASQLKLMYLPTPHTDFIFPVICEELGLVGALTLLGLFAALLVRGMRAARTAPNLFGALLAAGITLTLSLQAFINACMSIGLLPTKGMPMPFISYGGSSLLVSLTAAGILLNISRHSSLHASYAANGPPAISKEGPWSGARTLLGVKP